MIAFEVHINGEKRCTAGIGDVGVLTSFLTWRGRQPDSSGTVPDSESLDLHIGGLEAASRQHVRWLEQDIHVGDEILIRVIEIDCVDKPICSVH
jgi:hypothetical protein